MPSVSKSQQRLMGQAYAYKKGDLKSKDLNPKYVDEIKDLADSMTKKQLKDFAKTDHKGLPEKKKNESRIMDFQSFVNEGIFSYFRNKGLSKYLVTYKVTNYEATEEDWKKGRYSRDWVSNNYEYVINANSEDEAKEKFTNLWNKEVDSFEPRPRLEIISVRFLDDKETMGSFKNKLKFY